MSPKTAADNGLKDGDWAWMENADGRFMQKVKITNECDDRFIIAEHGWWKPETDLGAPVFGHGLDYNANNIVHAYESGPGNIGSPIKCMPVKIYPYKEGDKLPSEVCMEGGFRSYEPRQP